MYDYETEKPYIFTEQGQVQFLSIRDNAQKLLKSAGAATMERLISGQTGISWQMMACVDRLVELRELIEIPNPISRAGQHRIFIKPYEMN